MSAYDPTGRLLWSLSGSGLSTAINSAGNSGGWTPPGTAPGHSSAVDLGLVTDVTLYAWATAVTGSPSWVVKLDLFDDEGNLIPAVAATPPVTAAGVPQYASCGKHAPTGNYLVLTLWGRVSWTFSGSGASVTGAEISLYGN